MVRKLVCTLLLASNLCLAADPLCADLELKCDNLIRAQDKEIERIHAQVKECTDNCAASSTALPSGIVFAGGILAGLGLALLVTRH